MYDKTRGTIDLYILHKININIIDYDIYIYMNKPPKTIFCDIDGTLLYHAGDIVKNIQESPVILSNVMETIDKWEKLNY